MRHRQLLRVFVTNFAATLFFLGGAAEGQTAPAAATESPRNMHVLFLIGDSTVNNNANGGLGWGTPFAKLFDPDKITVVNRAIAGRSARSFYSEGRWDGPTGVKRQLHAGDFVLMQFGTNDGGNIETSINGRPDLPGIGEEATTGRSSRGAQETVHTYGWYLTTFVRDTKAAGATPIIVTMVPHNVWESAGSQAASQTAPSKIRRREAETFVQWCRDVAKRENAVLVDLNSISALRLETEGPEAVRTKYFTPPGDGTHTNPAGAQLNAESVVMGLRALNIPLLMDALSEDGRKLEPAEVGQVFTPPSPAR